MPPAQVLLDLMHWMVMLKVFDLSQMASGQL
jgi:hypothetical protein